LKAGDFAARGLLTLFGEAAARAFCEPGDCRQFADAARNGYFVALDHMYFPGIGRLREESIGYRWLPIPYVNDAKRR
jgi:hypothetical protein